MKNTLHKIWLALGCAQMLALISGCTGGEAATNGSASNDSARVETVTAESAAAATLPIRISRAFFERSLTGSVGFNGVEEQSEVTWSENAPVPEQLPSNVIAHFPDRKGCAVYEDAGNIALCFRLMADVSSIGLDARDLTLEGNCPSGAIIDSKFVGASKEDNSINVTFQATCGGQPTVVKFMLRQV